MNCIRSHVLVALACATVASSAIAADYPAAKQGEWIARDFKFHTGEVMSEITQSKRFSRIQMISSCRRTRRWFVA